MRLIIIVWTQYMQVVDPLDYVWTTIYIRFLTFR